MGRRRASKIEGVGGVFFRARSPERLGRWYADYLGLKVHFEGGQHFAVFRWRASGRGKPLSSTIWAPFPKRTKYFGNGSQAFMVNYIVRDLPGLLVRLRRRGVTVLGGPDTSAFGVFAWVRDLEGNRIELWQPVTPRKAGQRKAVQRKDGRTRR